MGRSGHFTRGTHREPNMTALWSRYCYGLFQRNAAESASSNSFGPPRLSLDLVGTVHHILDNATPDDGRFAQDVVIRHSIHFMIHYFFAIFEVK